MLDFWAEIYRTPDIYLSTAGTIVQGFMGLVALLGAVVVFKVQLEDQAMQNLADKLEKHLRLYDKDAATYTPTQMMNAGSKIPDHTSDHGDKDEIKRFVIKMQETKDSRDEAKKEMLNFTLVSFLNVGLALLILLFAPLFATEFPCLGGTLLVVNILGSMISLWSAWQLVKRAIGYPLRSALS